MDEFEKFQNTLSTNMTQDAEVAGPSGQTTDISQLIATMNALVVQNTSLMKMMQTQQRTEHNLPEVRNFNVMPDLSKSIDIFTGETTTADAKHWLGHIESTAMLHAWPEPILLETAQVHLKGAAKSWYEGRRRDIKSWQQFRQAFTKTFFHEKNLTECWRVMQSRAQSHKENISAYFHDKIKLCKELGLSFREQKEHVAIGLWSRELSTLVMAKNHSDEDELYEDILMYERVDQARSHRMTDNKGKTISEKGKEQAQACGATYERRVKPKNINSARQQEKLKKPEIICFRCGEKDHFASKCQNPRIRLCYKCRSPDHNAKDCPKTEILAIKEQRESMKETLSKNVLDTVSAVDIQFNKYLREVKVNKVSLSGMIDPGSAVCILMESIVRQQQWPIKLQKVKLYGFGGHQNPIETIGVLEASVNVDKSSVNSVDICVVPDELLSVDIIVGRTYTENPSVVYYKRNEQLIFGQIDFPFKEIEVPTSTTRSSIKTTENAVIPTESIMFIRAEANNQEFVVPVVNETQSDVTLNQGRTVGYVTSLSSHTKYNETNESGPAEITAEMIITDDLTSNKVKQQLTVLFNEFRDCFAFSLVELGCTDLVKMDIVDNNQPVVSKPYRASLSERETMRDIIQEWRDCGIVTDTCSPYASPVLLVKKKTGEPRLVVDYRGLNRQTERLVYPIPTIDEQFENIHRCTLFSTLDLAHGYLQVPLTERTKLKTAFITPDETGQFERMIFGLTNAPYEFCKLMNIVLGPLRNKVAMCYLDDILVPVAGWDDMFGRLRKVLEALRQAKLTLKLRKCRFGMKRVEYLGFVISDVGIQPGEGKVEAIRQFPVPKNVHEVRRFLGLTSYFRRFIAGYAVIARPLSELTKKSKPFQWIVEQQNSFDRLVKALCKHPVLRLYNPHATITELHTDASSQGLGGILLQSSDDGELHPVYYISKKTTETETNYHSSKLELMAIVWCVTKLRNYLVGIQFVIYTDCQAITYMNVQKTKNAQVARWFHMLQEFNFEMRYRTGIRMSHVDALSRAPVTHAADTDQEVEEKLDVLIINVEDEVLAFQRSDTDLARLVDILQGDPAERTAEEHADVAGYSLTEGRLMKLVQAGGEAKSLYVIPKSMRKSIVVQYHDLGGHFGIDRTTHKIQNLYWFARMRNYVKNHIRACFKCIKNKIPGGRRPGELHPIPPPRRPFERLHADHLGPFLKTPRGNMYILVLVCALTKFVKLYAVKDTTTKTSIRPITKCLETYGIPRLLVTDRGACFTSNVFEQFCAQRGIHHVLNSTRWPQANGQVERVNRTIIPALASIAEEDRWDVVIPKLERDLNTAYNKTISKTPYEALHGYLPNFDDGLAVAVDDSTQIPPEIIQNEIQTRIVGEQQKQKVRYDKRKFKGVKYEVGEVVYVYGPRTVPGESSKLKEKYRGPFRISAVLPNDTYYVTSLDSQRKFATTANVAQLKIYRNVAESESDTQEEEVIKLEIAITQAVREETSDEASANDAPQISGNQRAVKLPAKYSDYVM